MKRLLYGTTTAQGNDTTSATNALVVRNSAGNVLLGITNDGAVRIGTNASATTQTTASINASGSGTNIGLALVPKGTGAITASIPDGTATGGNARGDRAVDLQTSRSANTQVASGANSVIGGGINNTASGSFGPVVCGGYQNDASGAYSTVAGGQTNTASGLNSTVAGGTFVAATGNGSFAAGDRNQATSAYGCALGHYSLAYLHGQASVGSGSFATVRGDAQTSQIRYRRSITGTAATELFLDGSSIRGIINLPTGATAGRVWNAKIQVVAVCTVQGAGTVTAGEVYGGNYSAIIKRIGNSTSIVGAGVISAGESYDTNMETSVVTISADDTNESLKIEFTPPTTAAADTVIRVVATVYLTEVGY